MKTIAQRVADLVFFSDLLLGCLGVGSVSEVDELGWGLRHQRDAPTGKITRLGLLGPDAHLETPRRKCNDAGPYSPLRTLALKPLPNQPQHDPEQGKACGKAERKVN